MSKELECLKRIDTKNYLTEREHKEFLGVVEQAIKEYEAIKNTEPTKAMECLESMYARLPQWDLSRNIDQYNTIKQALLKSQEQEKENELLKEIIKSLFDRGCPLHQYTDKDFGLTIEVDNEFSIMHLGEYKGIDLDKKLKELLKDE